MTKLVLCDYDLTNENYKCPKITSNDWDELADPCYLCIHKIFQKIEE